MCVLFLESKRFKVVSYSLSVSTHFNYIWHGIKIATRDFIILCKNHNATLAISLLGKSQTSQKSYVSVTCICVTWFKCQIKYTLYNKFQLTIDRAHTSAIVSVSGLGPCTSLSVTAKAKDLEI